MGDPPRLRSDSGSWEARLLRSAPILEPPPAAQEELWRRLETLSAVAAVTSVASVASGAPHMAAAGSKAAGKALWISVLKWTGVVAIGVPAASLVVHREIRGTRATTAHDAVPSVAAEPASIRTGSPLSPDPNPAVTGVDAKPLDLAKPKSANRAGHTPARVEPSQSDTPSALRAESLLLGVARAKLASGDSRGALENVALLGVQFPHGRLVQEREVLAIDCLAAMGDVPSMRTRARAFLTRFSEGPYAAHVRRLLQP